MNIPGRQPQEVIGGQASAPEWVVKMQAHFQQTGAFRPSDIGRVLGNPLGTVEVRATQTRANAAGLGMLDPKK